MICPRSTLVAVATMMLCSGGCGGSSHSSSSSPTQTGSSTPTTASTTTSKPAPARHRRAAGKPGPAASGIPPAPDGLRASTGYATYELCSSGCSGSIPVSLRRALATPSANAACSTSRVNGPVKPLSLGSLAVAQFIGSSWEGGRVIWMSAASYTGPVLIRGRQVGGSSAVGFGEGHVPYDELQLLAPGMGAPAAPGGGREWLSFTRVRGPGCYFYQVDGTSFSEVILFRATG